MQIEDTHRLLIEIISRLTHVETRLEIISKSSDDLNSLLTTFCILNVAETGLSIYLIVSTLVNERNNTLLLQLLITELKSQKLLPYDWSIETVLPWLKDIKK